MAEKGSVYQKGGGGTNFEQSVQSAYLTLLIINGAAPIDISNNIIEVAFQTTNRSFETDDLLVITKSKRGNHNLLFQIKTQIVFSDKNAIFQKVIDDFWKDFNNANVFNKGEDYLFLVTNGLTEAERNHIKVILNWAKTHATASDFISEVNRISIKKQKLEIFRRSLQKANNNESLDDESLWHFLKSLDILDYDFGNENSVDENFFQNLIEVSRNKINTSTSKEIWSRILYLVSKFNKDGGSITKESIQYQDIFSYFDLTKVSPYFECIEKLQNDGELILKPIKNNIGEIHLSRRGIIDELFDKSANSQITFITGNAGVGKSAVVKDFILENKLLKSTFIFKADQFNVPNLSQLFSSSGINNISIENIFSLIALSEHKIIFIDSLERLLEADPMCSFKQLVSLLDEYRGIKIIATTRAYAIDLICQKFELENCKKAFINVPNLSHDEILVVKKKYPFLEPLIENSQIRSLIQVPKYLDFCLKVLEKENHNLKNISISELKNILWNFLIVKKDSGIPLKREKAFLSIAINRAKEMKLFTSPNSDIDDKALLQLENDNMIFQHISEVAYSPSHDILEDWALIKYINNSFDNSDDIEAFFKNIGDEPAIRRAFRLWIEDNLVDDFQKINNFITEVFLSLESISRYWIDEVLVAILKSKDCKLFFDSFGQKLLEENFSLLKRIIHLLKTACRENISNKASNYLTIGSGWKELIIFISEKIEILSDIKKDIFYLILEWDKRLFFNIKEVCIKELNAVKRVILQYIQEIENKQDFWFEKGQIRNKAEKLIPVLFKLTEISSCEIKELIKRASANEDLYEDYNLQGFYSEIIIACLSGSSSFSLSQHCPDLIIDLMWDKWKYKPDDDEFLDWQNGVELEEESSWGITTERHFFPSGIFSTPLYNLLFHHPYKAANFIIQFLNYSVEFYSKCQTYAKHNLEEVSIKLNTGEIIKQIGCFEMWEAYRSNLYAPHGCIESLLMALEYYMLEIAEIKTKDSKKILKALFNYLLKNTNNSFISGVLASVAMAYPEEVEEEFLPLISVEQFYDWDFRRAITDGKDNSLLKNTKVKMSTGKFFNELPHRKMQYDKGLQDFVFVYQLKIKKLNPEIQNRIDEMLILCEDENIGWLKKLHEIDARRWVVKDYNKNTGEITMEPTYNEVINKFHEIQDAKNQKNNETFLYSDLITEGYNNISSFDIQQWRQCYIHLSTKSLDYLFDKPVHLSLLGLRNFKEELSFEERDWCYKCLKQTISLIIKEITFRRSVGDKKYNYFEKEIALTSFHILFDNCDNDSEREYLIQLFFSMIIAPISNNENDSIINYTRDIISEKYPEIYEIVWWGILHFAEFEKKSKVKYNGYYDKVHFKSLDIEESQFLVSVTNTSNFKKIDLYNLEFDGLDWDLLLKLLKLIPCNCNTSDQRNYIEIFNKNFLFTLGQKKTHRNRKLGFREIFSYSRYYADFLIHSDNKFSVKLFNNIIFQITRSEDYEKGLFDFVVRTLECFVNQINENIVYGEEKTTDYINRFKLLWNLFFDEIKHSNSKPLLGALLLDIHWSRESIYLLESIKVLYQNLMQNYNCDGLPAIVRLLSSNGSKVFLPDAVDVISDAISKNKKLAVYLVDDDGENLIKTLYLNHVSKIKSNKRLMKNYLFILDNMIDLGSSAAYFYRENVISYKDLN
ncbi:hypothetical protein KB553_12570 [Chryseobacterium rhizoplanae]|uniref:hypothetical protein n=1 Tax=Chryseobacterium rhizoplanae TaxID=1609531 RepID=UPI001CE31A0D|nr:hypothetical protein [Chryseobacterium rhizoplanae]UCA57888.1 hypothetical protein KB553_12570 [Chryseobacterium rhizoplanae]